MIPSRCFVFLIATVLSHLHGKQSVVAYTILSSHPLLLHSVIHPKQHQHRPIPVSTCLFEEPKDLSEGVVELDEIKLDSSEQKPIVPRFLSQGDIDPETLNPDLSDPKQARVILYIILSLIPVLFLIPLMLGTRDLIPLDDLPPVQL